MECTINTIKIYFQKCLLRKPQTHWYYNLPLLMVKLQLMVKLHMFKVLRLVKKQSEISPSY